MSHGSPTSAYSEYHHLPDKQPWQRYPLTLVFNNLSRQSILQVVDFRLADVQDRLSGRRMMCVDDEEKEWLAKKGCSDVYGARAIARVAGRSSGLEDATRHCSVRSVSSLRRIILPLT